MAQTNKEYIIWCDESVKKGEYYSNFYGGVLIKSNEYEHVNKTLEKIVNKIGINEEIKWQKVDAVKLPAFIALIDTFFNLVKSNKVKVRIMFRQNAYKAKNLTSVHEINEYFLLYYQFVKHAFGLKYSNKTLTDIHLKIYFDYLPDTISKCQQFKEYIKGLESSKDFIDAAIKIRKEDVTEVDSKKHLIMQMLDVVLGAIQFRLNNKHLQKIPGKRRRGKKTIAKEKLYKHINKRIREIKPGFNIGVSTSSPKLEERWQQPYRHWNFKPSDFEIDTTKFK